MRVLKKDLAHGVVKLLAENPDDLWHLRHIVERGDLVHAVTYRRDERSTDMIRAERTERRRMYLGIKVESVEFHDFSDRLRIHGIIKEGPDDVNMGAHHTLNIEVGDDVKVQKERWRGYELDRIQEAVRDTPCGHGCAVRALVLGQGGNDFADRDLCLRRGGFRPSYCRRGRSRG